MTEENPSKEDAQRQKAKARDVRVYPEGNRHDKPDNTGPKRSQKQPGQELRDPQKDDGDGE